ncbi:MAG: ABC transporter permease [Coprobacillus sp.]|nr:ABC transporter permease [Coprobacillus sp.]
MTAFNKTVVRMFHANRGRFSLIICIITVSLILCAGLGVTTDAIEKSYNASLQEHNVSDIILKSTETTGFSEDDISLLTSIDNPLAYDSYFTGDLAVEVNGESKNYRLYSQDLATDSGVNSLDLVEGSLPSSSSECVLEKLNGYLDPYEIGDTISVMGMDYTVSGFVYSPLYSSTYDEPMLSEDLSEDVEVSEYIDAIIYIDSTLNSELLNSLLPTNEIALRYNDTHSVFKRDYTHLIDEKIASIKEVLEGRSDVALLTLDDNASFAIFTRVGHEINIVAIILPIFFILVCALVISVTTSRMVNDDRAIIGCYNSLGISRRQIINKYFLFNLITILVGGVVGIVAGIFIVPAILYPAYVLIFDLGGLMFSGNIWLGVTFSIALLLIVLAICYSVIVANLRESPAALLQPKAPKAGKKIFLEKLPKLWNKIRFSIKSSIRNIFRFRKNSILTIISVMFTGSLVFVGFGLLDNSLALVDDPLYSGVAGPMQLISVFIVIIAGALCVLVLFNLVNMNIKERTRELSTLKVLGYHDTECLMYTSRETVSLSVIGSLLGLPLGYGFMALIASLLDFGSASNVTWESYIYTFLFMVVVTIVVCAILYPSIKKLDMNESLKVLD